MRLVVTTFAGAVMLGLAVTRTGAAISVGQVDTFEDGLLQSWSAGSSNPNGPVNVISGGPTGSDDNFLRLTSNGFGGSGSRLVTFNSNQWAGNYLAAGVESISMQVNNLGSTDLSLRLIINSMMGTVSAVSVPAGSGWQTVSFPLTPANLSGGSYASVMSGVFEIDLVHSPGFVTIRTATPSVAAQLGVDNIRAVGAVVPEPAGVGLGVLLTGMAALRRRRRFDSVQD